MKLIINSPGIYLAKRGECFLVKNGDDKQEFSCRKVQQILITTAAAISTDAIELAVENNIDIVFLKFNGQPLVGFGIHVWAVSPLLEENNWFCKTTFWIKTS